MAEQTTQPTGETIGTGTNTLEATGNAKLDARKMIMARAEAGRAADVEIDAETHPSIEAISAALNEAAAQEEAGEEVRNVTEEQLLRRASARERGEADPGNVTDEIPETPEQVAAAVATPSAAAVVETPAYDPNETLELKVFGQTLYMDRAEVEARGGVAAVQYQLAADFRFRQATALAEKASSLHTAADQKLNEAKTLEQNLLAKSSAPGGTPAGTQPGANQPPANDALRAAVKKSVGVMWKGDPEGLENALIEVFAMVPRGNVPSTEDITALVLAKVEASLLQKRANEHTAEVKAAREQEANDVNKLMATKYAAIDGDPELRAMAQGFFKTARADPRNAGRSLVSIIDDVGARMQERGLGVDPGAPLPTGTPAAIRAEVRTRTTMKRRIPQPSSASERAAGSDEQTRLPTASDVVNMMRAARNQPPH